MNEQLDLAQELYNAVYSKYEAGMANGIDLSSAELQLEHVKNDIDQAEWILHQARYGLFYAMGLPTSEQKYSIEFSDTLQAEDINITQIQALAVQEEQPDFKSTQHLISASNFFMKEAKSNLLPDISLSLYKQDYGDGYNYNGFEVGLKLPLWIPFEQKGKIKIAQANHDEVIWKQNEIKLNMKKQIEYAWHNYSVSRNIINRYNTSLKLKSEDLLQMSLKAYQLGEIDLLNLLNAQRANLQSEQQYISALRNYYLQLVSLEKYLNKQLVY
jgi:cobalt-zinc-cadmium efflux system outer membrane protein